MGARRIVLAWVLAPGLACAQVSVAPTRALEFGKFVAASGGSVSIAPAGARSRSGGVLLLPSPTGAAGFLVSDANPDNASRAVVLTLPEDGTVQLSCAAGSMALSGFASTPSLAGTLSGGSLALAVGATLNVAANQAPGNYAGFLPVTVEYQ